MKRVVLFVFALVAVATVQAVERRVAVLAISDRVGQSSDVVKMVAHHALCRAIDALPNYESCDLSANNLTRNILVAPPADEMYAMLRMQHNIDAVIHVSLEYTASDHVAISARLFERESMRETTDAAETAIAPLEQAMQRIAIALCCPASYTERAFGLDMSMVRVAGGHFVMGLDNAPTVDEQPAHDVELGDYYIAATEVTQAQWRAVMGNNPSFFKGDDLPVDCVSWEEASAFCRRLSERTGRRYLLPTEAQWEYAARGRGLTSHDDIAIAAWYEGNSEGSSHPVAQRQPNALGLYDMFGNIWEWCNDWFAPYDAVQQHNPTGPVSGTERVLRGGSWIIEAEYCRPTYRNANQPTSRDRNYGFRVVCLP